MTRGNWTPWRIRYGPRLWRVAVRFGVALKWCAGVALRPRTGRAIVRNAKMKFTAVTPRKL